MKELEGLTPQPLAQPTTALTTLDHCSIKRKLETYNLDNKKIAFTNKITRHFILTVSAKCHGYCIIWLRKTIEHNSHLHLMAQN